MPYIYTASFNRQSGTDSDWTLNAQSMLTLGGDGAFTRCRLANANVTWTAYNVTTENNFLTVQENGGGNPTFSAFVPVGQYSIDTLPAAVQTALIGASAADGLTRTYTVSISELTNKVTIASTGPFMVKAPTARLNALNQLLGFSLSSDSASLSSVTASRCWNMNRYAFVAIEASCVGASQSWLAPYSVDGVQKGELAQIIGVFQVARWPFGSVVSADPPTKEWLELNGNRIRNLRFRLLSETGEVVDLNGSYVTICLEVE